MKGRKIGRQNKQLFPEPNILEYNLVRANNIVPIEQKLKPGRLSSEHQFPIPTAHLFRSPNTLTRYYYRFVVFQSNVWPIDPDASANFSASIIMEL
jgi:hypothetical protein